jgi:hypothetical protein
MHRVLISLIVTASLSVTLNALALDGPKSAAPIPAPKLLDHADELFEQGATAYDAGRFPEALAKLEQAWELKRTHDIAGNLGVVELKLGKYPEAATHLAWALKHFPPTESDQARQGFQKEADRARAQSGTLRIRVNVAGAEVSVNGQSIGKSPLSEGVYVAAGSVNVVARHDGYADVQQAVAVPKGESRDVSLVLAATDGKSERRGIIPGVVMSGVAGAALITGIVLAVDGANKRADARTGNTAITSAHHSCVANAPNYDASCAELNDTALSAGRSNNAAHGLFIGAGVAAIGAVAYFLWPSSSLTPTGATLVVPTASSTSAGLIFAGSF